MASTSTFHLHSLLPLQPLHFPSKHPLSPSHFLPKIRKLHKFNPKPSLSSSSSAQFVPTHQISSHNEQTLLPFSSEDAQILYNKCFELLRLSTRYCDVELARAVHSLILKLDEDNYLYNSLISVYINLGLLSDAYIVFTRMSFPDVVSYTTVISGLGKFGYEFDAIELFFRMRDRGIEPNEVTFVAFLAACSRIYGLHLGFQVHGLVVKLGFVLCTYVANALMSLYCKSGCLDDALQLFDEMGERDISSWNTVISGTVGELMYDRAFELFRDVSRSDGFRVDHFTLSNLISACSESSAGVLGREIHAHVLKFGFDNQLSVSNALIAFYTKCGSAKDVAAVFERMPIKNVISWTGVVTAYMEFGMVGTAMDMFAKMPERNAVSFNAVLAGLCKNGEGLEALSLFDRMVNDRVELTEQTVISVVKACSLLGVKNISEQLHCFVMKFGIKSNARIEAALIDMCTRCGRMADAQQLFDQSLFNQTKSINWTSLICGYARNAQPEEAIAMFQWGLSEATLVVDEVELTAVLGICGTLGLYEFGQEIHSYTVKKGFFRDVGVGNALISVYAKCGYMEESRKLFESLPTHDVVSWNCLIAGYLLQRQGDEGLAVWSRMKKALIRPDSITFTLVISSYRYTTSSMLDDCRKLFFSMKSMYDVEPTSDNYASYVSVLGDWGFHEEAEEIIAKMPCEPKASVWRALLHSCQVHSDSIVGQRIAKRILAIKPQDASTYILISNLLSASGRWHCAETIREEMTRKGIQKHPARSWIVHQSTVHSFYTRDRSHYESKDICRGLEILILECLKVGYVPDTSFVLHEIEEQQKTGFLYYHSAKLAVTYGLLTTKPGKPIRVTKNVLLCGDCHNFLKHVSKITEREICLRDTSGFHYFSHGTCSCNDHW
ncbi:pentatricopeptide repeat-containing protein At5g03800 [Silene latifolia]|uniref:pentatricopeptide repeat-containing protein At5g03800 n=1 Tax=Silene latifolia TaxID=37657 RepID=UPI003D77270F